MVSSMANKPWSRVAGVTLLIGCTVGFATPATAGPAADVSRASVPVTSIQMRRCTNPPAPASIIADVGWPQQRYDLSALSQITDGSGVTVAVVDSGVDAHHPQLAGAVRAGADMLDRAGDGRVDCVGHGTAVASVIAARPVPGSGLRGIAPGVGIFPVRASERVQTAQGTEGAGDVGDLAAGIRAAVSARPRPAVINLSISTTADDPALRHAIGQALAADIVVVAAVGNRYADGNPTSYPAAYEGVVGVGAIDRNGERTAESAVGSYVDITAPGADIVVANPGRGHVVFHGTSVAAPFVSATAALIRARWPRLSRTEVVNRLMATADAAPGPRDQYGAGILNPLRAVSEVLGPAAKASPVAVMAPAGAASRGPQVTSLILGATAILFVAAAAIAGLAALIPTGRQRRWRPPEPKSF